MTPDTGFDPRQAPSSGTNGDAHERPPTPESPSEERVTSCRQEDCGTPEQFIGDSGWCRAHDPELADDRKRASALGGARTALKWGKDKGIHPDELGPLASPQDAARWAAIVGAAVAAGRITAPVANSIRQLLGEFRAAHEAAALQDEVDRLRKQLGRAAR